jgi:hypothetical protein
MSNWIDLQAGPSTTVTTWHVCKIANQKTMQKLILALEPDALSSRFESSRGRRDDGGIINAHINSVSDNLGHTQCLSFGQRDVVHKAIGWI